MNKHFAVISSWAPPMIGGPVLLFNLLSQLPQDMYHIFTDSRLMATGIDPSTWLPGKYTFVDRPHTIPADITTVDTRSDDRLSSTSTSFLQKIIHPLEGLSLFRDFIRLLSLAKTTLFFIRAFNISQHASTTTLLGLSDSGPALLATYYLSRKYKIPYSLYLFDLYRGNNFPTMDRIVAHLFERRLLLSAKTVIVNNEGTEEYLHKRYGNALNVKVIHNGVFPEKYPAEPTSCEVKEPFEIVFTGNISWPQEGSLLNLLKAAKYLADLPLTITLYTNRPPESIINEARCHPNVHITYAPYSQMPSIQKKASLLFLPLAWNTKGPDIISTATPGKLTDYLAVGRPILVHAPDYAYISKYARRHDFGLVVDHDNPEYLANAIRTFLLHPNKALPYVQNARKVFRENHDARKNLGKLTEILEMV